jgi:acyl carrier protein
LTGLTIEDRVLKVIATSKRVPIENVHPDSSFESLGIDSLDRLNILFDLESEFDIEIKDEDAKKIQNIREMVEGVTLLVDSKQKAQAATE